VKTDTRKEQWQKDKGQVEKSEKKDTVRDSKQDWQE
jgi:hypothetical protein